MNIQIPEWIILIILIGVTFSLLCQFSGSITLQQELMKHSTDGVSSCPNGTKQCLLRNHLHPVVHNGPDHGTSPANETKTTGEYNARQLHRQKKLTQRRKAHLPANRNKHGGKIKGTDNEDFIDGGLAGSLRPDSFDIVKLEETNISQQASLDAAIYTPYDVVPQNADTSERRLALVQLPTSDPESVSQPMIPPPILEGNFSLGQYEPHQPNAEQVTKSDCPTVNVIFSYMVGGFLATTVACLSALLIDSIYTYAKTYSRKCGGYKSLNDTRRPKIEVDTDLNLSRLPPDLLEMLVKKLDVRRKGERFYGWQKLGAEFKVDIDDLRYLKIEYKRDNGSPTSKLLEILGITKNATMSELVDILNSAKVNRPDVTTLIKLT